MNLIFRVAKPADTPSLLELIYSAYRRDSVEKGWTNEVNLFAGNILTQSMLIERLALPGSTMIVAEADQKVVGCIRLRLTDQGCFVGPLAVAPKFQSLGVGRSLLLQAEKSAAENGKDRMRMQVINSRKELLDWYHRRGYQPTGETLKFEPSSIDSVRSGISQDLLNFVILEKLL